MSGTKRFLALYEPVAHALRDREPAHDFLHVMRVAGNAEKIATSCGADVDVARTAALLHELVNFTKSDPRSAESGDACALAARDFLVPRGAPSAFVELVADAISDHAFTKGAAPKSLESAVLQDADRLDAIGAIGVARCFATASEMHSKFYSTQDPFCETRSPDDKAFALDHFYKKLLLIEGRLHTEAARELAKPRVAMLHTFLDQIRAEITG